MPIDPKAVVWDDAPKIDPKAVKWDDAPAEPKTSLLDYRLPPGVMGVGGMSGRELLNTGAGAIRGAGSIGATAFRPFESAAENEQRRRDMTEGLGALGADTDSLNFKAGKIGGEVAGTAGFGGLLANGARAAGAAPAVVNALATNGFRTGVALPAAQNLAIRSAAGAATGAGTVGLADPEHAGTGALIGGAVPGAAKLAGEGAAMLGDAGRGTAKWLMKSALKPVEKARRTGDADVAAQTLLDYGINPTNAGVAKLKGLVGEINDKIAAAIEKSDAKIDPQKVVNALSASRQKFGNQVSPTDDLNAIGRIEDDFLNTQGAGEIPIQLAQKVKQGTYRVLRGKYGEQGSASTEAQKDLARGLKEQVAEAAPEVGPLNAEESKLLKTLVIAERRALLDANKNPVDLGSIFALASGHPGVALGSIANSTAWTKAMGARALNRVSGGPSSEVLNALSGPAAYRAIPSTARR